MSVLIKGMDMPKNCYECLFAMRHYSPLFGNIHINKHKKFEYDYSCIITHKMITSTRRSRFCPLVEVPTPHGRLIDADELETFCDYPNWSVNKKIISGRPTVIESED